MAMVVSRVIEETHEGEIVSVAYNRQRREIYTAADGDKIIKVWDSRTGQLLRTQQGHKGMVTCLLFASNIRLLFSGSIDSTVGIWTEKGVNLQMSSTGGIVFSIAWDERRRFLIVGGHSIINIYKVDLQEARKLSQQQRSVASGLKDGVGDTLQILRRAYAPMRGPDLCHNDVVKCIVVTDTGKIMSGGFDKAICIYEFDKLDKPREAFTIKRKCHQAAIISMAYDSHNNCILTGSIDGSMKVWSVEGRPLDNFENINDQPVCVAYVAPSHTYWASGRFGRLLAFDPRAPCNVTAYTREANSLDKFKINLLYTPPSCDLIMGATRKRQLVIWQYDKSAAYRVFQKHEAWIESLVIVDGSVAKRRAAIENQIAQEAMEREAEEAVPIGRRQSEFNVAVGQGRGSTSFHQRQQQHRNNEGGFMSSGGDEDQNDLAPEIFSAASDGKVLRWKLDADTNCDAYECIEELQLHKTAIHCMTYSADLDSIITGGDDASIRVHSLSGVVRTFNDVPLPTRIEEHESRVSGLVLLPNNILLSTSYDRSIRVWDLTTMKPLACILNAHDSPIQCTEYNPERQELATCGMGNKVKVWDVSRPAAPRPKLILNHADQQFDDSDEEGSHSQRSGKSKSNMQWLTRSDIQGLPKARNPLVDDIISKASHDTPEVTQVRWIPWRNVWVTAADDDMIRLWSTEGQRVHAFAYSGGSCQMLYVDCTHKLLLAAMLDKVCYVYDLDDPIPSAAYKGHQDVIRSMQYLPTLGCYITASWDKTLRLWISSSGLKTAQAVHNAEQESQKATLSWLDEEEGEEHYISTYEKEHPLEVPRALTEADQWGIMQAMGFGDDEKVPKKGRARHFKLEDLTPDEPTDPPGSLGSKLNDLSKELLAEINSMANQRKKALDVLEGRSAAGSGVDKPHSKSRPGALQGRRFG